MTASAGELRRAGLGAAREARASLAALLDARGDESPELAETLSSTIATLYGAEVADDDRKLLDALATSMNALRALFDEDRWAADDEVARGVSRALALLHSPRAALASSLGDGDGREGTAPFLLTSARVKAASPPDEKERRGAERHELEVDVGLEGESRFYTGRTGDLGRGGLFVATDAPLPVGTALVMSFVLPDGYRVRADGRVAWVRAPRYRPNELPAGMGVRFEHLGERDLHAIRHFLEERPPFHYGD